MSDKAVHLDNLMFLHEVSTPKELNDYSNNKSHPTLATLGPRHLVLLVGIHREGYFAVFSTATPYSYFATILGHIAGTQESFRTSITLEHMQTTNREDWRFFCTAYVLDKKAISAILKLTGLRELNDYLLETRQAHQPDTKSLHSYYRLLHKPTGFARWAHLPSGTPHVDVLLFLKRAMKANAGIRMTRELPEYPVLRAKILSANLKDFEVVESPSNVHRPLGGSGKTEVSRLNMEEVFFYKKVRA